MSAALATYRAVVDGRVVYEGRPVKRVFEGKNADDTRVGFDHSVPWAAANAAYDEAKAKLK